MPKRQKRFAMKNEIESAKNTIANRNKKQTQINNNKKKTTKRTTTNT